MGLFWEYFKSTLRLPSIQKGGPLALLAEGGAATLDTARDVVITLRDQFFPARCEDIYLARFARSRGIVRAPLEPEDHWLARVRFAYHWWLRGGRASAMAEGLKLGFGFTAVRVVNLRAEDPGKWAQFRVELDGVSGDVLSRVDQIRWAINEVKPARSKLFAMRFAATPQPVERYSGIAVQRGGFVTIYPPAIENIDPPPAERYHAAGMTAGHIAIIYPGD